MRYVAGREPQLLAGLREAVFSSTGFRIRAAQGQAAGSGLAGWAEHAAASLFFTFFPAHCRVCGFPLISISRLPVCESCLGALRPLEGTYCSFCGEALLSPAFVKPGDAACELCQGTHPPFEKSVAYGGYDGGLRDLIHLLKYQQVRPAAAVLGRMLMEAIAGLEGEFPAAGVSVIPVPLHERKQRQRGFNQSELIARAALKNLARPDRFRLLPAVLARTRERASQISLTRHQRRENLRGVFKVVDANAVIDRAILLVDDVFATGTTASECSRLLRRAGAKKVWVATVARTLRVSSMFAAREQDLEEAKQGRLAAAANG